jgi:hypothetical protein
MLSQLEEALEDLEAPRLVPEAARGWSDISPFDIVDALGQVKGWPSPGGGVEAAKSSGHQWLRVLQDERQPQKTRLTEWDGYEVQAGCGPGPFC